MPELVEISVVSDDDNSLIENEICLNVTVIFLVTK